jgi:hypothetical protein
MLCLQLAMQSACCAWFTAATTPDLALITQQGIAVQQCLHICLYLQTRATALAASPGQNAVGHVSHLIAHAQVVSPW